MIAGATNVIDMSERKARVGAELVFDGGGDSTTAYVLRVRGAGSKVARGKVTMLARSKIVLQNGMCAENLVIYNAGRRGCRFGNRVEGYGTVLCPDSVVKIGGAIGASWDGVLLGGKGVVKAGTQAVLTHVPPLGVVTLP